MRYVPSLPPPFTVVTDRWGIRPTTRVGAVKRVQERSVPPLVFQPHHALPESPPTPLEAIEKRHEAPSGKDRRTYCRRVAHLPILEEFRSGLDRRRHNLRADDMTEHIDVEV